MTKSRPGNHSTVKIGIVISAARHETILLAEHNATLRSGKRAAKKMAAVAGKYLQLGIAAGAFVHAQFKRSGIAGTIIFASE